MTHKNTPAENLEYEYWVRYETAAGGRGWTIINTPPLKKEEAHRRKELFNNSARVINRNAKVMKRMVTEEEEDTNDGI